eukprot:ANDGO_00892.mRNA.1 CTD nuclear envelope phosphatase 1 homolog
MFDLLSYLISVVAIFASRLSILRRIFGIGHSSNDIPFALHKHSLVPPTDTAAVSHHSPSHSGSRSRFHEGRDSDRSMSTLGPFASSFLQPDEPECHLISSLPPPPSLIKSISLNAAACDSPKKILFLDLDETLIHSSINPESSTKAHYKFTVTLDGTLCDFYVFERPFVDAFLQQLSFWYELWIFTASLPEYANPVIDRLDRKRLISKRLFRQQCTLRGETFVKDIKLYTPRRDLDLSRAVLLDNSPHAGMVCEDNLVPCISFYGDYDEELLDLIPFFHALWYVQDVRSVIRLRKQVTSRR